jgi:hypothetical protein
MAAHNIVLPVGALFFEQTTDGGGAEVEWCDSVVPASKSLGGMVQRGIGDRRSVMDARRMAVWFGVVLTSMTCQAR